jgi:hypothetical protein
MAMWRRRNRNSSKSRSIDGDSARLAADGLREDLEAGRMTLAQVEEKCRALRIPVAMVTGADFSCNRPAWNAAIKCTVAATGVDENRSSVRLKQ